MSFKQFFKEDAKRYLLVRNRDDFLTDFVPLKTLGLEYRRGKVMVGRIGKEQVWVVGDIEAKNGDSVPIRVGENDLNLEVDNVIIFDDGEIAGMSTNDGIKTRRIVFDVEGLVKL